MSTLSYNYKYNIGDKIRLNKIEGLNYGDHWDKNVLTLTGVYEIADRMLSGGKDSNNKEAYNISFNSSNGLKCGWWVGLCDIKPIVRQLTFIFHD